MKTISYRSAFRGARAPVSSTRVPAVDSPVGPDSTSVGMRSPASNSTLTPTPKQQAAALRKPEPDAWDSLPPALRSSLLSGYQAGGFEGVAKAVGHDWYDLPEHLRTQILDRVRGGE